jgi:hypothetical protein
VDRLLTLGEPALVEPDEWDDYLALSLSPEHIPDLVRLATDRSLKDPDDPAIWGPIHARRALGQLRAEAAIGPLLTLLPLIDEEDDDWVGEELPPVFGMIGPAALPGLAAFLADRSRELYGRIAAGYGLRQIGEQHPAARADAVQALVQQLERADPAEAGLNGFVLGDLLKLQATEAAPAIEKAFAAGAVDESIAGDLEYALWQLGLRDKPPPRRYQPVLFPSPWPAAPRSAKTRAKAKAKRKQAAKSRKRNRKRK